MGVGAYDDRFARWTMDDGRPDPKGFVLQPPCAERQPNPSGLPPECNASRPTLPRPGFVRAPGPLQKSVARSGSPVVYRPSSIIYRLSSIVYRLSSIVYRLSINSQDIVYTRVIKTSCTL